MPYIPEYAQITQGLGKLTPEVMARIGKATEITLGEIATDDARGVGVERNYKWMRIISSSVIVSFSGKAAKWVYTIKPAAFTVTDSVSYATASAVTVVDGSTNETVKALNFSEWGTDVTTISPGVAWANVPAGFELKPIANNTVVLSFPTRVVVGPLASPTQVLTIWGFSMVNTFDGACEGAFQFLVSVDGGSY
jgi:hypothetical protein